MSESASASASLPSAPLDAAARRRAVLIVFFVVVIDLLGFAIVLPLLPRIAKAYLAGSADVVRGLTLGLLFSSFSAMQFLFAPLWGRISDRIGRRPILLLGLVGSVIYYALFGYAASLPPEQASWALFLLFFSRIGAGIAGATISTASAAIADCTPPEQRKRGMALIGAAFGIGFTCGPLLAFAAVRHFEHHGAVGYVAAGLSLIALILGWILLPETRVPGMVRERRGWLNPRHLVSVLATPAIGLLVIIYFLATFGFASFESTLSLFTETSFHFGDDQNFLVFAYVGFVLLIVQGGIYRPLAHRFSEIRFIQMGVLMMLLGLGGLAVLAYSASHEGLVGHASLVIFLALMAIATAGFAFLNPSVNALISRRTDAAHQGEVLGVNQSANALARILGPTFGLSLFTLTDNHMLPYLLAALLLLLVLGITPRLAPAPDAAPDLSS